MEFLNKYKTTMDIRMELNCINKQLKTICQLQKLSIKNIHLVLCLIKQLTNLFMQKMRFKLKIWIKNLVESSLYYTINGLTKKV